MYASVIVDIASGQLDKAFHYIVPEHLADEGAHRRTGTCALWQRRTEN